MSAIRSVFLASDGDDFGVVLDRLRSDGHPAHVVSREFNDLLAEGLLRLDEEQVIRRCATCVPVEEGRCGWCDHAQQRHSAPDGCDVLLCGCTAVPAADRQTDEERWDPPYMLANTPEELDRALRAAERLHPEIAARPAHADAVMADLGAAITEGVTEVRLRARMQALADEWDEQAREFYYDNRHTHENGIEYAAGYEDGWSHAADLLRAALGGGGS